MENIISRFIFFPTSLIKVMAFFFLATEATAMSALCSHWLSAPRK